MTAPDQPPHLDNGRVAELLVAEAAGHGAGDLAAAGRAAGQVARLDPRLADPVVRASVHEGLGDRLLGEPDADADAGRRAFAGGFLTCALWLYEQAGSQGQAGCHWSLGRLARRRNDLAGARTHYTAAAERYEQLGRDVQAAGCQQDLGNVDQAVGDYPAARDRYTRALAVFVRLGLEVQAAGCQLNLGIVDQAVGDYPAARDRLEQALADRKSVG